MNKALETLKERGFYQQCTDENGLSALMDKGPITFYVGCDPTGPSLHIGHMVPFFAFRHLTEAGHCGIALVGGGTARIGDPSGKTEMRKMLTYDQIDENVVKIEAQLNGFLGFDGKKAVSDNNKFWLADLNYIDFLRDIGSCFSVNRMLTFEAYKKRMETGLTFIEFNYQLLQSFDFLKLHERHNCCLQIGGDDQWGNIVAGVDLIRRKTGEINENGEPVRGHEVFGLTFPLITRSDGKKMGKTEKGALFLDPSITPVFDFYQYWRNVSDADVLKFLKLFTFLRVEECEQIAAGDINKAKERLAWEVTAVIHGKDEADKALGAARQVFGGEGHSEDMPTTELTADDFVSGSVAVAELLVRGGLAPSKGEAKRLIQGGGVFLGDDKVTAFDASVTSDAFGEKGLIIRKGKKTFHRFTLK